MPGVTPMTPSRRLAGTATLFAVALVFLAIAAATHEVWPLFVGWIPLLGVPWLLTRPEADAGAAAEPEADERAAADDVRLQDEEVPSDGGEPSSAEPEAASEA